MGLMATAKGNDYVPPEENIYNAVCVGVYDLGTHNTNFGVQHQVYINWELDAKRDDGKPYTIGTKMQPSLHKKANFRKLIESWFGKRLTEEQARQGFDCMKLLGQGCQIQVMHKTMPDGRVFANVGNVIKLGTGMKPLAPSTKPTSFSFDDNGKSIPPGVPEWISKQIMGSLEWTRGNDSNQGSGNPVHDEFMKDDPTYAPDNGEPIPF